jgi:hypothetical protein
LSAEEKVEVVKKIEEVLNNNRRRESRIRDGSG